jgi:transcriptional antiterminator Rof (Rho-off)
MTTYQPVSCELHTRLELAIMQRRRLSLEWLEDGVRRCEEVLPVDIYTRAAAEWLEFVCAEVRQRVCLDQIVTVSAAVSAV